MLYQHKNLKPGFSFIELMVGLMIIALIAAFAGPKLMQMLGRGRRASTQNTLNVLKQEITQYKIDVGSYPPDLNALLKAPEGVSNWQGPYTGREDTANPEIRKDEWGNDLIYIKNPPGTLPPFQLYSNGDPEKENDRIDAK